MNESEFETLLQYIQTRMRRLGLSDVTDRILASLRLERSARDGRRSAHGQLIRYLDLLESELLLSTQATIQRTIDRFREVVRTDSQEPIDGFTLYLSEDDQRLFGVESIDLGTTPNLERILLDIRLIRNELAESRDSDQ